MFFRKLAPVFLLLSPAIALAFTLTTANMQGWKKEELKFRFNPANCGTATSRVESAIRASVDIWNAVPTSHMRVTYTGQTGDTGMTSEPIVNCVTSGISGAIGVGSVSVTTADGEILYGEIQMNKEPGDAGNIDDISDAQLEVALAHEMGHIFGLGHSTAESALMYYSLGQKQEAHLSQDDIDGITWLYGRKEPGDGIMGCGSLQSGGPGAGPMLWVLAFAGLITLALRGRSRRLSF